MNISETKKTETEIETKTDTETSGTETAERLAFRKANLYIKGIICGYAKKHGMKYESKKATSPWFEAGWKVGQGWMSREEITGWHILYNSLRGTKRHIGDPEKEKAFCSGLAQADRTLKAFMGESINLLRWQ